ncbi:MAG: ABC transporter permease, partial [Muribaculaceae bacterium]|nr:ABC transporter permease [Muribaculaceae bacterium]
MNLALFIARRLSLAAGGRRSSPAVRVATVAVALSVAVMMASIAVVQGFKKEITDRVTGFNSHISVYAERLSDRDDNIITLTPTLRSVLDAQPDVAGYSLQAMAPAVLKTSDDFKGVYLKSLADSAMSAFIGTHIDEGSLPDFTDPANADKTVISRIAARQLGLAVGDRIDTYFIT